ncbi:Prolyl 4-hydroxylase, alpha polypeptide [Xylographa bjoerkii]|nr:Prolyl 4-hydroxylase, alpha polypeptide [Xylographa bjoerkii]
MTTKASSNSLHLSIAFLPTLLSVLYLRWNSLPTMLDIGNIGESDSSLYNSLATNVTSLSTFDQLREQYAKACPEHSYKARIFSTDPLIIYLENYITAPEREYIVNMAEPNYVQSEVAESTADDEFRALIVDSRSSQSAYFYDDPVTSCIQERSASFQGNVPVDRIEVLQVVKYMVGDQFRHHRDWIENAENRRISTFFAYLACDSGESGSGGQCQGGATHFPNYLIPSGWCDVIDCYDESELGGVAFKPIAGNAIFWMNVHPNGTYHEGTYHAGMPVKKGQKIGLNIWTHQDEFSSSVDVDEEEFIAIPQNQDEVSSRIAKLT